MTTKLPPHRARAARNQQAILDYIKSVSYAPPYYPTLEEIRASLGFKHRSNVEYNLNALAQQGKIKIISGLARGIRLAEARSE